MEKRFKTVLAVPKVWKSLLEISSFDDLTAFLEREPPPEAIESPGLTRADWPRPFRNDRRQVSFKEDNHTVCLQLRSGHENYFTLASVVLPNGERYAHTEVGFTIHAKEVLEIKGIGKFAWSQRLI